MSLQVLKVALLYPPRVVVSEAIDAYHMATLTNQMMHHVAANEAADACG